MFQFSLTYFFFLNWVYLFLTYYEIHKNIQESSTPKCKLEHPKIYDQNTPKCILLKHSKAYTLKISQNTLLLTSKHNLMATNLDWAIERISPQYFQLWNRSLYQLGSVWTEVSYQQANYIHDYHTTNNILYPKKYCIFSV